MSAAELLAKLAPSSVHVDRMPGGAVPELTQTDIAAALTGASNASELLVRAKYAGDESVLTLGRLKSKVLIAVVDLAIAGGWKLEQGKNVLEPLANLALDVVINPPRCRKCKGRGEVYNNRGVVRGCIVCNGSGRGRLTDAVKAERLGVHRSNWTRTWKRRFELLLCELYLWEMSALLKLREMLREEIE